MKFLLLGASYKKNISDTRESPSIKFFELFDNSSLNFKYHDPFVKELTYKNNFHKKKIRSVKISSSSLKKYDCVIILTDHDCLDYNLIHKNSKLIFDSRGIYKKSKKVILI